MRWRSDRLIALNGTLLAALLMLLVLLALTPRPAHAQTAEDAELAQLVQQAYDHPDEALAELLLRRWLPESGRQRAAPWPGGWRGARSCSPRLIHTGQCHCQTPGPEALRQGGRLAVGAPSLWSDSPAWPAHRPAKRWRPGAACRRGDELSSVRAGCPTASPGPHCA